MHPGRRTLLGFLLLAALPPGGVQASVHFALGDEVDPGRHFLVSTYTLQTNVIQGQWTHDVDSAFLRAGEERTIHRIPYFVPLLYSGTYARFYHPAYRYGYLNSDRLPLFPLDLGNFHPEPWSRVLEHAPDSADVFYTELPEQITDHFRRFLTDYLPAFDRRRITEDLGAYLQLFRELAAFVHSDTARSRFRDYMLRAHPNQPGDPELVYDVIYSKRLDRLDDALVEIEAWLRLEQPRRTDLRDWLDKSNNADYLISRVMDDADRAYMMRYLDNACTLKWGGKAAWRSTSTGIDYTLAVDAGLRKGFVHACSGKLEVNLAPVLGLEQCSHCTGKSHPQFTRSSTEPWSLK